MKRFFAIGILLSLLLLLLTACSQAVQPAEVNADENAPQQELPADAAPTPAKPVASVSSVPAAPSASEVKAAARSAEWQQLVDDAVADGWVCGEQWVCKHGGPMYVDTAFEKDGETQVLCGRTHKFLSLEEGSTFPVRYTP